MFSLSLDCFMAVGNQEKLGKRTILQVYYGGKCTDHTQKGHFS